MSGDARTVCTRHTPEPRGGRTEGKSVAMTRTDLREVLKGGTGFYLMKLFFLNWFYEVSRFLPSRYSFFHFFWFRDRDRRKKCHLFWDFCLSIYFCLFILFLYSFISNVIFACDIFLWKLNKRAKEADLVRFIGLYCRSKSGQQRVKCAPLSCNSSHVARNRSCLSVSLRFRASLTICSSLAPSLSLLSLYSLLTVQLLSPSLFLIHSLWFSFPDLFLLFLFLFPFLPPSGHRCFPSFLFRFILVSHPPFPSERHRERVSPTRFCTSLSPFLPLSSFPPSCCFAPPAGFPYGIPPIVLQHWENSSDGNDILANCVCIDIYISARNLYLFFFIKVLNLFFSI